MCPAFYHKLTAKMCFLGRKGFVAYFWRSWIKNAVSENNVDPKRCQLKLKKWISMETGSPRHQLHTLRKASQHVPVAYLFSINLWRKFYTIYFFPVSYPISNFWCLLFFLTTVSYFFEWIQVEEDNEFTIDVIPLGSDHDIYNSKITAPRKSPQENIKVFSKWFPKMANKGVTNENESNQSFV